MELVEDHAGHALERGVALHAAGEDALGDEAQAGARAGDVLETHLVAHGVADGFAALGGDVAGGETGGEASRFEHDDLARVQREQRGGHARGLSRAGRRFQHQVVGGAQVGEDLRKDVVDGQAHAKFYCRKRREVVREASRSEASGASSNQSAGRKRMSQGVARQSPANPAISSSARFQVHSRERTMKPILVIGATGNIGGQVVAQLTARNVPVRALVRKPEAAALPQQVEIVRGDLTAPATLDPCLDGVDTVFLVWTAPASAAAAALERVVCNSRRIVYLSAPIKTPHPFFQQPNPGSALAMQIERTIEASSVEWTFLRPGMFALDARGFWGPQIRAGDTVRWPYLSAPTAPIDERDIAAVAVLALIGSGHAGMEYVLTGPDCTQPVPADRDHRGCHRAAPAHRRDQPRGIPFGVLQCLARAGRHNAPQRMGSRCRTACLRDGYGCRTDRNARPHIPPMGQKPTRRTSAPDCRSEMEGTALRARTVAEGELELIPLRRMRIEAQLLPFQASTRRPSGAPRGSKM